MNLLSCSITHSAVSFNLWMCLWEYITYFLNSMPSIEYIVVLVLNVCGYFVVVFFSTNAVLVLGWYVFCMTNIINLISLNGVLAITMCRWFASAMSNCTFELWCYKPWWWWWYEDTEGADFTDVAPTFFSTLLSHYTNKTNLHITYMPWNRENRKQNWKPIDMSCER